MARSLQNNVISKIKPSTGPDTVITKTKSERSVITDRNMEKLVMAQGKNTEETTKETPKKKSRLVFFIIAVVLLFLGGGGFFVYTTILAPAPTEEQEVIGLPPAIGEIFALEPFVLNLADPAGRRFLRIKIKIELNDLTAVERAQRATPRLRDSVIMMLTALSFEEVMTHEGKIRIREELLARFNVILRPDRVRNIYFTEFVVQ